MRAATQEVVRAFLVTIAVATLVMLAFGVFPAFRHAAEQTSHAFGQLERQLHSGYAMWFCFARLMRDVESDCPEVEDRQSHGEVPSGPP